MKRGFSLLAMAIWLLSGTGAVAQEVAWVRGIVTDQAFRPLELVNVSVVGGTTGTTTAPDGSYKLQVPAREMLIIDFSFIGYQSSRVQVNLDSNETRELHVVLQFTTTELPGFEVRDQQVRSSSYIRLDPKDAQLVPSITGGIEALIKTLPGVSSTNELSSQYMVRGGNYDENLVYVNGIEIYRPFLIRSGQQEGLSFINSSLVAGIIFSAGGWEARYGDKLSSVLDIQYRKPVAFGGSAQVSLLGAQAHLEGVSSSRRFTYLAGARYKTNQYILNALETEGAYRPNFADFQGLFTFDINEKLELSLLGYYSWNSYTLEPESRETNFGTLSESYRLQIYFDGQEEDKYKLFLGAMTLNYRPDDNLSTRFIITGFNTIESETFDIRSQYWIGKLEQSSDDEEYGNVVSVQGVGTYMDHARNFLDGRVASAENQGSWMKGRNTVLWGLKYQHERFDDSLSEWGLVDSAGFSLPYPPPDIGEITEPKAPLVLDDNVRSQIRLSTNRYSGYIQDTREFSLGGKIMTLTAGLRFNYWDYNSQLIVSPRVALAFKPLWKRDIRFRFAAGLYDQPPFYKELRDPQGVINPDIRAQRSFQAVVGTELNFRAWDRPFKYVTEIYYKYLFDLIPYFVDNVRIRYLATNNAHGFAAGLDMKISGEFIKGVDSWASLSVMKTMEDIEDDYYYDYYNESGEIIIPGVTPDDVATDSSLVEPGYIPRPTDQRVNFSLFFQDYLPRNPTYSMHLTLVFGSGLPFGPPESPRYEQDLRYPPYRRVDLGFAKQFIGERTTFKNPKNLLRHIRNAWISLEVFNLFGTNNTVSYIWVKDINQRQYAVPNYLTPRRINLRLLVEF
jgi:hypothetical protein